MALNKQIHIYNFDTACFYTDEEYKIHKKLSRCYSIRKKIKSNKNSGYYKHHLKKINKIINKFKNMLYKEFSVSKSLGTIRNLREDMVKDTKVISIFESNLTRILGFEINELTEDIMVIQVYFFQVANDLITKGFTYKNERYVLFSASAGQIRTKKFVSVKESLIKKHENTLTCGLTWDIINAKGGINANKYLAYYSLNNSATEIWEDFNIDKSIVVEDFETFVNGVVDFIDDITYEITKKKMNVPIPHTDGCGIMLEGNNLMVRLPWLKGLMGVFRFDKLILEWREKYNNLNIGIIKDIYGIEHDIIKEDIKYIFTKSQFKMYKYYDSWDQYKENFKKYKCQACYCNEEEDYILDAQINYQMLQTLFDITEKEMCGLSQRTINDINKIGSDYITMMKILGVTKYNENKNYMQQAIEIYPELMRDKYNRQILKDCRNSIIKNAKAGKLSIKGKYTFVLPDLYAFCEWLFLGIENPNGLLNNGEVSCLLYKNGIDLDCLRSPHLWMEHAVRTNVINDNIKKWFNGKAIYVSTKDLISKYLMFDVDGDKLLVVADKLLCRIAKRNMKDVTPLYYDMKKSPSQQINIDMLLKGLSDAYRGGKIGLYSNNISKIWNCGNVKKEQLEVIKLLCMENNFCIDMAKTLYMPKRPKEKDVLIKKYTKLKLPHFFIYAKDKTKSQVARLNNSPMNMLDKIIVGDNLIINNSISKLNYKILLSNSEIEIDEDSNLIIGFYDYWNVHQYYKNTFEEDDHRPEQDLYIYQKIRKEILNLPFNKDYIVDTLVKFLYTDRKSSHKKLLWACFGGEIVENIKKNTEELGKICPICGKRFEINSNSQKTCSNECARLLDIYNKRKIRLLT